jgi:DNA-binding NarL/FixJ family response regulator
VIRVLLVDDHEIAKTGLRTMLEPEPDLEVVGEASSANGIIDLIERTSPDVVLLDARLPGTSGAEACRMLRSSHSDVSVIMVTTYTDDALVDECLGAGAKGYIVKDVERFHLKEAIRAVARGQAVLSPSVTHRLLQRRRLGTNADAAPVLTDGQLALLRHVAEGLSNREIARRVHLSENTVKSQLQEIFRRMEVRNRTEAALRATRDGWL